MAIATRRSFLISGASATLALGVSCKRSANKESGDEEVTPAEDLMREHGLLRRIMYLYDETANRLTAGGTVPLDALGKAATELRRFVEDYHERMEEQFVFPRFEAAGQHADLTAVLRKQHDIGRALTTQIQTLSAKTLDDAGKTELSTALRRFNHMYQAHAAREDTDLFPAIRGLVGEKGYAELGELLEDKEHEILGKGGFEEALQKVADLEKEFGVSDLATL